MSEESDVGGVRCRRSPMSEESAPAVRGWPVASARKVWYVHRVAHRRLPAWGTSLRRARTLDVARARIASEPVRRVGIALELALTVVLGSTRASAEPTSAPTDRTDSDSGGDVESVRALSLPHVPTLRLSLPSSPWLTPTATPPLALGAEAEAPSLLRAFTSGYWRAPLLSLAPGYLPDSELSWQVDTFSWRSGNLHFETGVELAPAGWVNCPPECHGGMWSSRFRLGYDLGAVGPVQQVTPFFELQREDTNPVRRGGAGLARFGMRGAF
jgi:hypothetical protein